MVSRRLYAGGRRHASGPQIGQLEGVRMQAATEDLHPQHLFESHVAELHPRAKVLEEGELAGLVGSLKHRVLEAELTDKAVGVVGVEGTVGAERANTRCALARLDDQRHCAGLQPLVPPRDRLWKATRQ